MNPLSPAAALALGWPACDVADFFAATKHGARVVHVAAEALILVTASGARQCVLREQGLRCVRAANLALAALDDAEARPA